MKRLIIHIASPLAGWLSDRGGTSWIAVSCLLLAVPWWAVLVVQKSLALFIVAIAIQSMSLLLLLSLID